MINTRNKSATWILKKHTSVPPILVLPDHLTETMGCKGWTSMTFSLSIQANDASPTCFICAGESPMRAPFLSRCCKSSLLGVICHRLHLKVNFSSRATSGPQHFACSTFCEWLHGQALWCTIYCPIIGLQQKLGAAGVSSFRCTHGKATCLLRQAPAVSKLAYNLSGKPAEVVGQLHTKIKMLERPYFFRFVFLL